MSLKKDLISLATGDSKKTNKALKSKIGANSKLTTKQELFCYLYTTNFDCYGNGAQSYAKAYGFDLSNSKQNTICRVNACKLLTNANILKRIREIQDEFLCSEIVDKELAFLVLQRADLGTKIRAIAEYNKIKGRYDKQARDPGSDFFAKLLHDIDGTSKDIVGERIKKDPNYYSCNNSSSTQ